MTGGKLRKRLKNPYVKAYARVTACIGENKMGKESIYDDTRQLSINIAHRVCYEKFN